jgi:hypothetical protein
VHVVVDASLLADGRLARTPGLSIPIELFEPPPD